MVFMKSPLTPNGRRRGPGMTGLLLHYLEFHPVEIL
jgi:hypothetical protein